MPTSPEELLQRLGQTPAATYPRAIITEMIQRHEEMIPHWLATVEDALAHPDRYMGKDQRWLTVLCSLYLLAQHRVSAALEPIAKLVALPNDQPSDMLGDLITGDLCGILASVAGGRLEPIQRLIENPKAEEYSRSAGVRALVTLVKEGDLEKDKLAAYFGELMETRLEREPSVVWENVCFYGGQLRLTSLLPLIRQAYATEMVDSMFATLDSIEEDMVCTEDSAFDDEAQHYVTDTIQATEGAYCFQPPIAAEMRAELLKAAPQFTRDGPTPPRAPALTHEQRINLPVKPPAGRNDPCPCGSGKKYKKCCGTLA